jgi:hypothetical protein
MGLGKFQKHIIFIIQRRFIKKMAIILNYKKIMYEM